MTSIIRRFKKAGPARQAPHNYGRETAANTLRRDYEDMERDAARIVSETRFRIERDRDRERSR